MPTYVPNFWLVRGQQHSMVHAPPCCLICHYDNDCVQVMNDLVVDRGPNPYLTNLIVYCNEREMTSVQGDGTYYWHEIFDAVLMVAKIK